MLSLPNRISPPLHAVVGHSLVSPRTRFSSQLTGNAQRELRLATAPTDFGKRNLLKSGFGWLALLFFSPLLKAVAQADDQKKALPALDKAPSPPDLPRSLPVPDFVVKPGPLSENVTWPDHVRVLASSGQDFYSWIRTSEPRYSYYSKALVDTLRQPNVLGIEEAHAILESTGYYFDSPDSAKYPSFSPFRNVTTHYPTPEESFPEDYVPPSGQSLMVPTSTLRKLGSWQKDVPKTRYAVLIGQREGETHVKPEALKNDINIAKNNDLNSMESVLGDLYGLRKTDKHETTQILRINAASHKDTEKAVEWLKSRAKPGDELLFYYTGHGNTNAPKPPMKEGDAIGEMLGPAVSETQLKSWVETKLGPLLTHPQNPARMLIVMDKCHAGADIALTNIGPQQVRIAESPILQPHTVLEG